ncbi:MAG: SDR family oxidoreductase [Clostridia bacterium]|nr:SDR family oxidoreductase [Clostridia bacterium]
MNNGIFLTGGTGFLGTALSAALLNSCDSRLYVLVRAASREEALHRLKEAWAHDPTLSDAIGTRAFALPGDFTLSGLGVSEEAAEAMREGVTRVFHVGGEVGFQSSGAHLESINRDGTANMLAFASALPGLRRFVYVSTAYVAGRRQGRIREDDPVGTAFSSLYEQSKARAEVLVRGVDVGGTTTLATGNAVACDGALKALGIDLEPQFEALKRQLPITQAHRGLWNDCTRAMFDVFADMGLDPVPTPKFIDPARCARCGHCAISCPTGAKWDTRSLVNEAVREGAQLITGCRVTKLDIGGGRVNSVHARHRGINARYSADLVVLAAGGLGTPVILERSGIPCEKTLFVDPVLCVAGPLPGADQGRQLLMPFISQQDGYILSPYMDWLSFFFNRNWRLPMGDIVSVMVKLADEETGSVEGRRVHKHMTGRDNARMETAVEQCREILKRMGVPAQRQFLGTLNAGHPGGMLPLTGEERESLHSPRLPGNLYVADATVLPGSLGNPPILTIMALAKKMAQVITANC